MWWNRNTWKIIENNYTVKLRYIALQSRNAYKRMTKLIINQELKIMYE